METIFLMEKEKEKQENIKLIKQIYVFKVLKKTSGPQTEHLLLLLLLFTFYFY